MRAFRRASLRSPQGAAGEQQRRGGGRRAGDGPHRGESRARSVHEVVPECGPTSFLVVLCECGPRRRPRLGSGTAGSARCGQGRRPAACGSLGRDSVRHVMYGPGHEAGAARAPQAPCGKEDEGTERRSRPFEPARASVTEPAKRVVAERRGVRRRQRFGCAEEPGLARVGWRRRPGDPAGRAGARSKLAEAPRARGAGHHRPRPGSGRPGAIAGSGPRSPHDTARRRAPGVPWERASRPWAPEK